MCWVELTVVPDDEFCDPHALDYPPGVIKTLMTHSLNKEASQLLCDAMRCRVEDGDADAEDWTDSKGNALRLIAFGTMDWRLLLQPTEREVQGCTGIELNIWERVKVGIFFFLLTLLAL